MRYVDEFRDGKLAINLVEAIKKELSKDWTIMEICGGQTHSIMKYNLMDLLPDAINLVHGPGCPVCVTPIEMIDKAIYLAQQQDVILVTFGDMLRVPGSKHDLLNIKAQGGDIRTVLSPLHALELAKQNKNKKVVFFAVGFETTAPAIALSLIQAKKQAVQNFFALVSHVLVPPAMQAILNATNNRIQGFLAAGHVCTVMGFNEYIPITNQHNVPIVVTGFEPIDVLAGILELIKLLENNDNKVKNAYKRSVKEEGNVAAQKTLWEVFEPCDQNWRGIGTIALSGLKLTTSYKSFDIENTINLKPIKAELNSECIAGEVLTGIKKPIECPAFGNSCTPENPIGAPMVSSEGACAAYIKYAVRN